jgi:hypothetical protein
MANTLQPLSTADRALVHALQAELGGGDGVTAARWAALRAQQDYLAAQLNIAQGPANAREPIALVRDQADPVPLVGPRWWFHVLGLRHGSVHVVLTTPQGWFVAQRRSRAKDDAPGALDVAVTGHRGVQNPFEAAWRELAEEVGVQPTRAGDPSSIVGDTLRDWATYDGESLIRAAENPPFIDRERRVVYHAQLTATGMARLRFSDGEVSSLMLIGPRDLADFAARCVAGHVQGVPGEPDLAPGFVGTVPRWVAWQARASGA